MASPEMFRQENLESPQQRYEKLKEYYGEAHTQGRNRYDFPELKPEEITAENLHALSIHMNEGWGSYNTPLPKMPQVSDPWFSAEHLKVS